MWIKCDPSCRSFDTVHGTKEIYKIQIIYGYYQPPVLALSILIRWEFAKAWIGIKRTSYNLVEFCI